MPLCDAHGTGMGRLKLGGAGCTHCEKFLCTVSMGTKVPGPRFVHLRGWMGLSCALSACGLWGLYFEVLPWGALGVPQPCAGLYAVWCCAMSVRCCAVSVQRMARCQL